MVCARDANMDLLLSLLVKSVSKTRNCPTDRENRVATSVKFSLNVQFFVCRGFCSASCLTNVRRSEHGTRSHVRHQFPSVLASRAACLLSLLMSVPSAVLCSHFTSLQGSRQVRTMMA